MSKTKCYAPTKTDRELASSKMAIALGWNAHLIAALRGMYEENNEGNTIDNIVSLIGYHNKLKDQERKELYDYINNPIAAWSQLKEAFPSTQMRSDRYRMVALLFSRVVDSIIAKSEKQGVSLSREDVILGFKDKEGNFQYGPAKILNLVWEQLQEVKNKAQEAGDMEVVEKYQTIFKNWGALIQYALKDIKMNEGINIGHNLTFAAKSSSEEGYILDLEETTKERWQERVESISPLGSTSVPVRRSLGRLYAEETTDRDDLGFPRMNNISETHQKLLQILKGMESETHMLELIQDSNLPFAKTLLRQLQSDPVLRTQYFVDFKKSFQQYSMFTSSEKEGMIEYKFAILNKLRQAEAMEKYLASVYTQSIISDESSIFSYNNNEVLYNYENAEKLIEIIENALGSKDNIFGKLATTNQWHLMAERAKLYKEVFQAFGIYVSDASIVPIADDNRKATKLNKFLLELKDALLEIQKLDENKRPRTFKEAISRTKGKNAKDGYIQEKLAKLVQIAYEVEYENDVESSIKYQGNTYQSFIQTSFMGRFFDRVDYAARKGVKSIKDHISQTYNNTVLITNKWIQELQYSIQDNLDSFVYNFSFNRSLGDAVQEFSDFGAKKHLLTLINAYGKNTDSYGFYPVFIMGDSGCSKYVKAPRYSEDEIVDAIYEIYLSEVELSKDIEGLKQVIFKERLDKLKASYQGEITEEVENKLKKEAEDALGSYKDISAKFGLLPFLNNTEEYPIDLDNIEQSVKKNIRKWMNSSYDSLIQNLKDYELLTKDGSAGKHLQQVTKSFNKYTYKGKDISAREYHRISKEGTQEEKNELKKETLKDKDAVESYLRDYIWNTKFASIVQMQVMTISPVFYQNNNITDLQKRFKEVHASGNPLSIEAIDPTTGKPVFKNSRQRTVYFNEATTNTEDTDSEFMEVIAAIYGKESDIYKKYKNNDSTDGQSFRTLKSYREVMIAAGKWDFNKMEAAYNKIEQVRAEIRSSGKELTEAQSKELSKLLAIFSPIKPFLFTHERINLGNGRTFLNPVQYKCAECVLISELLPKNSRMRDALTWAEENQVDVLVATSAIKVGNFGSVDISSATDSKSLRTSLSMATIHELDYRDYVIQTNVPDHTNEHRLVGTQSRKLSFSNMTNKPEGYGHYIGLYGPNAHIELGLDTKTPPNGNNIQALYNSIIITNILEDLESFTDLIDDPERVRELLTQMTINNERETKDNLRGFGPNDNPEIPFLMALYEAGISRDTQALLLSQYKKQVNKQKINGGSAVQVSAYGINGYNESDNLKFVRDPFDKKNLLYSEVEVPWDLTYTASNGKQIPLDMDDWCNPDGTLKLGKVLFSKDADLSKLSAKDKELYRQYVSYKDEKGNIRMPKIEEKFPGILSFIAYRIPTEEHYSMLNCKIVRFSRKINGGGIIKVPLQGVTIAGFDFDIDKLYFMRREYKSTELTKEQVGKAWDEIYSKYPEVYNALLNTREDNETSQENLAIILEIFGEEYAKAVAEEHPIKDRLYKYWKEAGLEGTPSQFFSKFIVDSGLDYFNYEKYDFSKTPWDSANTKVARNNVLIDLIQGRLSDPDTIVTRTTPGGFNTAKKASYRMKDLMGIDDANYDYTDPMTLVKFNQQNQVADKLIGIFANHNSHHAMISNVTSCFLETPISFAGKTLSNLKNPNALTKELLAASVDAVKDPVLNFLNLNPITANSGALLCRLGFSFEDIGLLLNQPIIKKVCDYCVDNNIYDIDIAINKVSKDLGITDIDRKAENTNKLLSKEFLESSIVGFYKEGGIINTVQQKAVIQLFKEIYATAQELSNFVTNTKFTASNSVPSTIGGLYTQQLKVFKYFYDNKKPGRRINTQIDMYNTQDIIAIDQNIKDKEDYIKYFMMHPFGYEQAMYDSNMEAIKLLNKYYPYDKPTFVQARDLASNICIGDLDEDTINDIHNFIIEYLLSNIEDSIFNPDFLITDESGKNQMTAKEYYTKMVPVLIKNLIKEGTYPCVYSEILQSLEFIESNDGKSLIMRISRVGNLGLTKKDAIRESWEDLLNNPNTKPIAIALYMYSYYTSGFGFGNIGFNHLAPLELKMILEITTDKSLSYTQFLEELMTNDKAGIIDFLHLIKNFIKKHPDNTKFVYTPIGNTLKVLNTLVYTRNGIEDIIEIDVSNSKSNTYKSLKKCIIGQDKETGITKFKPALMIGDELYIAVGAENSITFETKSGKMKYARVKNKESDFDYSKYLKYDNSEETNKEDTESPSEKPSEKPSDKIPVYTLEELDELSPEDIIDNIVDHDIILGELMIEDRKSGITSWKQQYQEALLGLTKESVKGMLIEVLQERYKKEGVVDSEGNLIC